MTGDLELIGEALVAYWSSPVPLSILGICSASMFTLLYVFLTNGRNAKLRVSLLTGFYGLAIFFWLFIAASLALCVWQSGMVAYRKGGVEIAAASGVAFAFAAAILVSVIVWKRAPAALLRRLSPRPAGAEEEWIRERLGLLSNFEGLKTPELGIVDSAEPLAMAVGGPAPHVLASTGLLSLLPRDEAEAVVAHELMHLKHHDAEFKIFSSVFSKIMFFDPFSKFFDPAVHREREYLADEMSARVTGRPASLASAILKIAGFPSFKQVPWGLSIYAPGTGIFSRYPPVQERVQRLLMLSRLLERSSEVAGKG